MNVEVERSDGEKIDEPKSFKINNYFLNFEKVAKLRLFLVT